MEESAADLRNSLINYWPQLEDAEITHVWGGQLGVPFDLIPHIGRFYFTGSNPWFLTPASFLYRAMDKLDCEQLRR